MYLWTVVGIWLCFCFCHRLVTGACKLALFTAVYHRKPNGKVIKLYVIRNSISTFRLVVNNTHILQEVMYFHICILLFLKLCMCYMIGSTYLIFCFCNATYLIMLITNYETILIHICTVVWLLSKTYSCFKKTFQLYASFLTTEILYRALSSLLL